MSAGYGNVRVIRRSGRERLMKNINFVQADLIWRKDWISRTPTKRFAGKPEKRRWYFRRVALKEAGSHTVEHGSQAHVDDTKERLRPLSGPEVAPSRAAPDIRVLPHERRLPASNTSAPRHWADNGRSGRRGVRGAETVAALSAKRLAPESASAYEGAQHVAR